MKKHYFFKLISPRPTFAQDITDEEKRVMNQHGQYFQQHFAEGRVLLFGPVLAREGPFGIGILEVDDEAEARRFAENDPSVLTGLNTFEIHPMRVSGAQGKKPEGRT